MNDVTLFFAARIRRLATQRDSPSTTVEMKERKRRRRKRSRRLNRKLRRKRLAIGEGSRNLKAAIGPESGCVSRTRERFPSKKLWRLWTSGRKASGNARRSADE